MGDEELNFTEEEAQCWANDACNQAEEGRALSRSFVVCALLVIAALVFLWLATFSGGRQPSPGAQLISGVVLLIPWTPPHAERRS
jgi:hypothetical protein